MIELYGALAQLGERMAGSHEVRGSIPLCSTIKNTATHIGWPFFVFLIVVFSLHLVFRGAHDQARHLQG